MKKKNNNNLIMLDYGKGKTEYYTSYNRVAMKLCLAPASIKWAIEHGNVLTDVEGKVFTIGIVDGSNILWKDINRI